MSVTKVVEFDKVGLEDESGLLVGNVKVKRDELNYKEGGGGVFLADLEVHPDHRGQGLGRELLRLALERWGHLPIRLWASPYDNSPLTVAQTRAWYRRHEFFEQQQVPDDEEVNMYRLPDQWSYYPTGTTPDLLVWWVSWFDLQAMDATLPPLGLPSYISDGLKRAHQHGGRGGRLHFHPSLGLVERLHPHIPETHPLSWLIARAAGIAVYPHDALELAGLPGVVTDLDWHLWRPTATHRGGQSLDVVLARYHAHLAALVEAADDGLLNGFDAERLATLQRTLGEAGTLISADLLDHQKRSDL